MTNDYGYSLGEAIANRCDIFFKFHDTNLGYKALKIFFYIFTIPFILISIAEFLVLTTFKLVGKCICNFLAFTFILSILGIILGFIFGAIYFVLFHIFQFLFFFFILPEIIFQTDYCIKSYNSAKNQDSTQEVLANAHKLMLNETIERFKIFFKKYGFTPSPEEMAHIMTQYAMAVSEGKSDLILFQFIPDEIPSPNKFYEEITYHINSLLQILPYPNIKEKFIIQWKNSRNEISHIEVCELCAIQKATLTEEEQVYFRFNYELCAILMLASFCDDLIQDEEYGDDKELEQLEEFTEAVINLGKKLGYERQNP